MSSEAELELIRRGVNCATLLERLGSGWQLDRRESTKRALKYRGGPGRIIIVNHHGRGWWDATGAAKGDVFNLVQHLQPGLTFGEVRDVLRRFVGIAPISPTMLPNRRSSPSTPALRWEKRPRIALGDSAWGYLAEQRSIPDDVLAAASSEDAVRSGAYGSAWFAHRHDGRVTHVEVRGPSYKGSLQGGTKTLFRFGARESRCCRVAITEGPIDALSLAALERPRVDTLYVATGGGIGPGTLAALREEIAKLAAIAGALAIGTDANAAGDRYAEQIRLLAEERSAACHRLRPSEGQDWNDVLVSTGRGGR